MLFGIFNFLARNPIAQAIAGLLGFLIFWKTNNAYQRRKGRVQGRLEVSEAVNEKTNEIIEKMEDAGRELDALSSDELRDAARASSYNRGATVRSDPAD
jgi:hypothetical protein